MIERFTLTFATAAAIGLAAACDSPQDPFTSGAAHASVTGVVTSSGGTPIAGASIEIACAGGGDLVSLTTDASGHYLAGLSTGSDPFHGRSGGLRCRFSEPAQSAARVEVDTALGFARGPVLVALQFVDLHEP